VIQKRHPLNYQSGLGVHKHHPEFPGEICGVNSEVNQRGLYRRWQEMMRANDWSEISVPTRTRHDVPAEAKLT